MGAAVAKIKLRPRSTWKRHNGDTVSIAGYAKKGQVEGQDIFWSLQGDHFSEDGRQVSSHKMEDQNAAVERDAAGRITRWTDLAVRDRGFTIFGTVYDSYLYLPGNWRNIEEEDTSEEARKDWIGVKEDTDDYIPWRKRKDKR